jgi:hypothetical protein
MKRSRIVSTCMLLTLVFAALVTPANAAPQEKDKQSPPAKAARWQGTIVRVSKDDSTLSVRGGQSNMESTERLIRYDSSTKWTKQGKPAEQSDFQEGSFVIATGHADEKGDFHATHVDLRLPR